MTEDYIINTLSTELLAAIVDDKLGIDDLLKKSNSYNIKDLMANINAYIKMAFASGHEHGEDSIIWVKNKNGVTESFDSIVQASKVLGIHPLKIIKAMNNPNNKSRIAGYNIQRVIIKNE